MHLDSLRIYLSVFIFMIVFKSSEVEAFVELVLGIDEPHFKQFCSPDHLFSAGVAEAKSLPVRLKAYQWQ